MAWVKLEIFEDKVEIMRGKEKLKEWTEWIGDDLTEHERKVEWCIKREAEKYKKEGKKVKIGVYVNGDLDKILEEIVTWMEEREEGVGCLIGGDFNLRTGEEGGLWDKEAENDEEEKKRRSKDIKITNEERKFCKFLEKRGWGILNECIKGDEEEEWTYTGGRGNTVIDYVISDVESKSKIREVKVGEDIESNHFPLIVNLGKSVKREKGEGTGKKRKRIRLNWDEEERELFKEKYGEVKEEKDKNRESWEGLGKKIKEVKKVVKKVINGRKEDKKEQAKEV
ncbi:golgin subfamily A member 6-like protein 22 [Cardiocondyla obscurior]|uniref:golgin subfamily A member 6-like protein 22 n=1 Tax=Cardiocondyla obscurior TaxID=286306 RepID=UPI0039656A33